MQPKPHKPSPKQTGGPRLSRGRIRPGAIFPVAPPASSLPESYATTLQEIKTHLRNARVRAVRDFYIRETLPAEFRGSLPTIEEIEAELGRDLPPAEDLKKVERRLASEEIKSLKKPDVLKTDKKP